MTLLRAQVRWQGYTNVPEDIYTNTLYFYSDDTSTPVVVATNKTAVLTSFYQACFTGGYFSPVVANSGHFVYWYNMGDPEPRAPIFIGVPGLPARGAVGAVEEAAAVMSFQGERISGVPQARRRGRIYLGPLGANALTGGTSTSFSFITTTFRNQVAAAAETHLLPGTEANGQWVVWSPTGLTTTPVTDGWVDNAVDTQRRRGARYTGRFVFP